MNYKIKLDIFEGPLDLLLHLIKKNEVDIYDIPISVITAQYLEYIDLLKEMNLNLAGEFLLMAATLVHIKSRMLLPVPELVGEEDDGEDPREELIQRLLEYQRYKEASEELAGRTRLGRDIFLRGHAPEHGEILSEERPLDVSIFALVESLQEILKKASAESVLEFAADRFSVADKINHILDTLGHGESVTFTGLFPPKASRGEIIATFLAVLELAKLVLIKIHQTDDGIIRVYAHEPQEPGVDGPRTDMMEG
ncbi:MAG: segregation and condensation protein A [Thermodesulfobacteriota bacterium]